MEQPETAGQRLVSALSIEGDGFGIAVLIIEAGRIADRLAKLDDIISGEQTTWARLMEGRDEVVEVRIDNTLPEAARQATVLKQLLAEIQRIRSLTPPKSDDDDLAGI